jgi:hypothetical protein
MKTPEQLSMQNPYTEQHAKTAIEKIQNWVADRYPTLAEIAKSQIIVECLIEIDEERRFISAQ